MSLNTFKINNKEHYLSIDSSLNIIRLVEEENKVKEYPEVDLLLSEAKSLYKTVKTFDDFKKEILLDSSLKVEKIIAIVIKDNKFYLFNSVTSYTNKYYRARVFSLKLVYEIESDEYETVLRETLGIKDEIGKLISLNRGNNYLPFPNFTILELFLAENRLTSQNIPLYNKYKIKKKNGKFRDIVAPHEEIKEPLRELNTLLQLVYDKTNSSFQVAYKKGKSVKDNAQLHINKQYVYNIDLKDFFPSCKRELVEKYISFLFKNTVCSEYNKNRFLNLILDNDALFIGSPISGTLANRIIAKPVAYLKNICKHFGMSFSVYADDMTFSSNKFITKDFIINLFNRAFSEYHLENDFMLNKSKCYGASKNKRKVTGVTLNSDNKITISRKYYQDLRVKIHKLSLGDKTVDANKLRGKIAYATMLDDTGKIYRYLNKFINTVKQYKLCSDETLTKLAERSK